MPAIASSCQLCQSLLKDSSHEEGGHLFCCAGCQAVYQILSSQNAVDKFRDHPLFQQALQSGLIANPQLIEEIKQKKEENGEIEKIYLEVDNMWCPSCAQVIYLSLMKQRGIKQCHVEYATDLACIEFFPFYISKEKIQRLIQQLGYPSASLHDANEQSKHRLLNLRLVVAAFFSMNVMMFSYPIYASYFFDGENYPQLFAWLSFFGSLPVLTYCAWPIWKKLQQAVKFGVWGMESLVALGVAAATALSIHELFQESLHVYFDTMTVIILFVLIGKSIEGKAKRTAKETLVQLMRTLPRRGRKKFSNGEEKFVPIKDIQAGDCLRVLSGEKIVLDGKVLEGEGLCDESLMTGEPLPVFKKQGDKVLAGTVVQQGHFLVEVQAKVEETAFFHIIQMVENDMAQKSPYVRSVDPIVRWFVPFVICFALSAAAFYFFFESTWQTGALRAISILLISCPCAIGIAAPLAEARLMDALAKIGIIVRNRGCLAHLGKETLFVCDKTGTVTEGKYKVIEGLQTLSFFEKCVLKAIVSKSLHPVANALKNELLCPEQPLDKVEEIIGMGIKGTLGNSSYLLGSALFCGIEPLTTPADGIQSIVYFYKNAKCLAAIRLGDAIREEAKELLNGLKETKTLLLSGDSSSAVEQAAKVCGFNGWKAEAHPLQKRNFINELKEKGEIVAMLGDGVNDAPALTAAHVGIAVFSATDISMQVSDLLFTSNQIQHVNQARFLAKKTHCIINQNLFWAFFYNAIGLFLAAMGFLTPLFAAFAMIASSFIVLMNAQRIKV